MTQRVELVIDGHVAQVQLARAEKKNGLDLAMFEQLVAAGRRLADMSGVRAVVLFGQGNVFSAGLDFRDFTTTPTAPKRLLDRDGASLTNLAQEVAWVWSELPVPVIAAINGVCFGGGLQIALGADLRIASADAQFSVMEIEWGLIPDMGVTQTLFPLVRPDHAADLIFTGRIISGAEAQRIGLVTALADDPIAAATAKARLIAEKSPAAVRAAKRLLREAPRSSVAAAFLLETELQRGLLGRPEQMEAVAARMQKRPPNFE